MEVSKQEGGLMRALDSLYDASRTSKTSQILQTGIADNVPEDSGTGLLAWQTIYSYLKILTPMLKRHKVWPKLESWPPFSQDMSPCRESFIWSIPRAGMPSKKCEAEGCGKWASFNHPGLKRPQYCRPHSVPGMVNVVSRQRCTYAGCLKQANFNHPGQHHRQSFKMTQKCATVWKGPLAASQILRKTCPIPLQLQKRETSFVSCINGLKAGCRICRSQARLSWLGWIADSKIGCLGQAELQGSQHP